MHKKSIGPTTVRIRWSGLSISDWLFSGDNNVDNVPPWSELSRHVLNKILNPRSWPVDQQPSQDKESDASMLSSDNFSVPFLVAAFSRGQHCHNNTYDMNMVFCGVDTAMYIFLSCQSVVTRHLLLGLVVLPCQSWPLCVKFRDSQAFQKISLAVFGA